jgi:hypothetical protein
MGRDMAVTFRGDYVHVELSPEYKVDPERRGELWGMLEKICRDHDCRRILVEGFIPSDELPPMDVIDSGQYAATIPNAWIAFHFENFVPNEQSELFEVIAASKGVRVKHFADREHALAWLRKNAK